MLNDVGNVSIGVFVYPTTCGMEDVGVGKWMMFVTKPDRGGREAWHGVSMS